MPFEKAIEQVLDLRSFPSALNQATKMSGVPAIRHLRVRASPTVTSKGSNASTKYGRSTVKDEIVSFSRNDELMIESTE